MSQQQSQSISFADFGRTFQENLIKLIISDRKFSDQVREVLNYNFFEHKYLQVFIQKIYDYKDKYGSQPSIQTINSILGTELNLSNNILEKQIKEFFSRVSKDITKVNDREYIKDKTLDFCKKQKLKEAMLKSIDCLEKSSFDEISILINDALKLGTDNNLGYRYVEDFEDRYKVAMRNPISTGWEKMDNIMKGGLGKGEMGVVLAATGGGKSMCMVHLAAQAIVNGKKVVYYTLELSDTYVGSRFDSCITTIPLNELATRKQEVYEKIKDTKGILLIKQYPTKTATTRTIKLHLEKIISNGFKPDMVVVDYPDLLKPSSKYSEKRMELESIYEELRALAEEKKFCLWTCSQVNRSGLNAEIVTMDSISEAYNKCFVADFIFSLSRTIDDKNTNTGRFFIAKSRLGPDGFVFPIFMDTSNVSIKVLEKNVNEEEKNKKESEERQTQKLVGEKLKNYYLKKKNSSAEAHQ